MIKTIRERLKNEKGLTLIELLAVIVILGIIAAIAVPSIGNIIDNSRYGAIKSDAIMIINAAKIYEAENGSLPADANVSLIADYIEGSSTTIPLTAEGDETLATLKEVDGVMTINGTGTNGDISVTFVDASIEDINKSPKKYSVYKVDTKIPAN